MASIFLSYARGDQAKARRIAQLLEAAGHSVWWDRQLHAGARFTAEIDEALSKAEVIIVLWSRQSVESAWVQDESAVGRDSGRLFPVLREPVAPPPWVPPISGDRPGGLVRTTKALGIGSHGRQHSPPDNSAAGPAWRRRRRHLMAGSDPVAVVQIRDRLARKPPFLQPRRIERLGGDFDG